jgi:tetratricopeptide (TPR) repeat protein
LQPTTKPIGTTNPGTPAEIKNEEELYLAGQRILQFHNPTLDADPYWEEALRRDSGYVAANTGMGIISLRNAKFVLAEKYFRKANERLTDQFTTPKNAEPSYYLGIALKAQGRFDEAFTAFYKATWSQEWKSPAYFSVAEIASLRGDFTSALNFVNRSLDANALNVRAYGLKASILRHLNRIPEALQVIAFAKEKTDPLDVRLMAEQWLATKDVKDGQLLFSTYKAHQANAQENAAEYFNAGLWEDGSTVLSQFITTTSDKASVSPLLYYYLGYFAEKMGNTASAAEFRKQATVQSPEYAFPFQFEVITILQSAITANPADGRASYFLGNLLYDGQPVEATALWEGSAKTDPNFPITWRNLAISYSHQQGDSAKKKAIAFLEKAVSLANPYPTHFAELDRLYQANGTPVEKRLALLERNQKIVEKNDEALGSLINLKTFAGKADESIALLQKRTFSIWEGTTPFNSGQAWTDAHLVRGLQRMNAKKYREAIEDFESAAKPPENLRAEQRFDQRKVELGYWTGCAYDALGEKEKAKQAWNGALTVTSPAPGTGGGGSGRQMGGNSLLLESPKYYQALSKKKLGNKDGIEEVFNGMLKSAETALNQPESNDATQSSRRPTMRTNTAMAHYIAGLGYAGLGNKSKARLEFNAALASTPDYLVAKLALGQL